MRGLDEISMTLEHQASIAQGPGIGDMLHIGTAGNGGHQVDGRHAEPVEIERILLRFQLIASQPRRNVEIGDMAAEEVSVLASDLEKLDAFVRFEGNR